MLTNLNKFGETHLSYVGSVPQTSKNIEH